MPHACMSAYAVVGPTKRKPRCLSALAIAGARCTLRLREQGTDLGTFLWSFVDGRPIQNNWASMADVPASTPLSAEISKALKSKGFNFVGPVIVYAFMQACGMVNDHLVGCFRHEPIRRMGEAWPAART